MMTDQVRGTATTSEPAGRFRTFATTVRIEVAYVGRGPLLVKGRDAARAELPDMAFIRMPTTAGVTPFLPGSTIKGVLRSGAEALLQTRGEPVCDLFDKEQSCGSRTDKPRCQACLLFGSTRGASVVCVDDALPWPPDASPDAREAYIERMTQQSTVRNGIGVDRRTGSVRRGALFDYEVLVDATFYGGLALRNPTLDQVKLVVVSLFGLLHEGILRIGSGGSRGLGRVTIQARQVDVIAVSPDDARAIAPVDDPQQFGSEQTSPWVRRWTTAVEDRRVSIARARTVVEGWLR